MEDDAIFNDFIFAVQKFSNSIDKKERDGLKNNIFEILKIQDMEIRHSDFLAWLMDKNENQKIGTRFIYEFLKLVYKDLDLIKNLVNCDYKIIREFRQGLNGRIADIFISFEKYKYIVVIENKVYSSESANQLKDYYWSIEKKFPNKDGYTKNYIYLTLKGQKPQIEQDQKNWQSVSYGQILNILEKIKTNSTKLSAVDWLVLNYIDVLKNKTEKVMDRKKEYWKMYKDDKNKNIQKAMNEIVEFLPRYNERANIVKQVLSENNISLFSENSRAFLDFYIPNIQNALIDKNINSDFLYCEIGNNSSFNKCVLSFLVKLHDNLFEKQFYRDFRIKFNEKRGYKEKESKADYRLLLTIPLMNGSEDSQDELSKQQEIKENLVNILNNDGYDIVNKIVEYIKEYNFNIKE